MCINSVESAYIELDGQQIGNITLLGDDYQGGHPFASVYILLTVSKSRYVSELRDVVAKLNKLSVYLTTTAELFKGNDTTFLLATRLEGPVRDTRGYLVNLAHRIQNEVSQARSEKLRAAEKKDRPHSTDGLREILDLMTVTFRTSLGDVDELGFRDPLRYRP